MDPNSLSNLDPKLRETYERVMGTAPATPASAGPTPTSPTTAPTDAIPATPAATPVMNTPFATEQKPEAVTVSQPLPTTPLTPLPTPKAHGGLIKVLYILGGIVFFAIYIFFWTRIFGLKLPFIG